MRRTIGTTLIAILVFVGAPVGRTATSLVVGDPADYVIITKDAWRSALDFYVMKKLQQGYRPRVFSLEEISADYPGARDSERILNFIKEAFTTWGTSYVLLVGDLNAIPSGPQTSPDSPIEQDRYYTLLDGPTDRFPDIYLGRLPAATVEEVARVAQKWADYNTHGWGRSVLLVQGQDALGGTPTSLGLANKWEAYVLDAYTTPLISGSNFTAAMNRGYGLMQWIAHGGPASFWFRTNTSSPSFPNGDSIIYFADTDAYRMTNGPRLSFVEVFISCSTGEFHSERSIAKQIILAPGGGAIGYVGANDLVSLPGPSASIQRNFYTRLFDQYRRTGFVMPGVAFYDASLSDRMYNLLGDPTAKMDLLPEPPDSTPPVIASVQLSANNLLPTQTTSLLVEATDNDVVGVLTAEITRPDGTIFQKEIGGGENGSYAFPLDYLDTVQAGTYHTRVTAKDISQNTATAIGPDLVVVPDTEPPVITDVHVEPQPVTAGKTVNIEAHATDNASRFLKLRCEITMPLGSVMKFDCGTPFTDTTQAGTYRLSVVAEDDSGNRSLPYVTSFVVNEDPGAPVLQGTWVSAAYVLPSMWPDGIVRVTRFTHPGQMLRLGVVATDNSVDPTRMESLPQVWAEITKPDGTMANLPLTWMGFAWNTAYQSSMTDTTQRGVYSIVFAAKDAAGNVTRSEPWLLSVVDNSPPTAKAGAGQALLGSSSARLDGSGSFDVDGDLLTYEWVQVAGPTVALSDRKAIQPTFIVPDLSAITTLTFQLTVSDGRLTGTDSVDILVLPLNRPPVLAPIPDQVIAEGQRLRIALSATDPDGDPLTFITSNLPIGATFDPVSRTFSWTPGASQAGVYPGVHFEVSDGELTVTQDMTITVLETSLRLSGRIWTTSGAPVQGVEVKLSGLGPSLQSLTDAQGGFAFGNLQQTHVLQQAVSRCQQLSLCRPIRVRLSAKKAGFRIIDAVTRHASSTVSLDPAHLRDASANFTATSR